MLLVNQWILLITMSQLQKILISNNLIAVLHLVAKVVSHYFYCCGLEKGSLIACDNSKCNIELFHTNQEANGIVNTIYILDHYMLSTSTLLKWHNRITHVQQIHTMWSILGVTSPFLVAHTTCSTCIETLTVLQFLQQSIGFSPWWKLEYVI